MNARERGAGYEDVDLIALEIGRRAALCMLGECVGASDFRAGWIAQRASRDRDWDRFVEKIEVSPDGCWLWTAHTRNGYGRFSLSGRTVAAHRYAYERLVAPIPEGLTLDHLCRKTNCVNPAHLEPVSQRTNILRGRSPAARNARKTHCPKGHPYDLINTRFRPDGRRYCYECTRRYLQ